MAGGPNSIDIATIAAFERRHFSLRGTLRLHRAALGWDLLRAPINVALAPIHLITRLIALLLSLCGARRFGRWLGARRMLFPLAVGRAVETHLRAELLAGRALTPEQDQRILDYTSTRSAVSEIFTSLCILILGAALFRILTPGVISLAPAISDHILQSNAVQGFWLGQRLGGVWYRLFPVQLPVWYVVMVGMLLLMAASLVTTFAGIITDPVQSALGIHRRRLQRLMRKLDAAGGTPTLAREHLLARVGDLTDMGLSLIRFLKP